MIDSEARRPLKVRKLEAVQKAATILSQKDISPNHISLASMGFAALAGVACVGMTAFPGFLGFLFMLLALAGIAGRVLCNLFDGLVAVEGGKSTPSGELYNDVPDRIADTLIFVGMGYAVSFGLFGGILGWGAALMAVMTAYARTLGRSLGAPVDFSGPMAKPHRMGVAAVAIFLTPFEGLMFSTGTLLAFALVVIIAGSAFTVWRRLSAVHWHLESGPGLPGGPEGEDV